MGKGLTLTALAWIIFVGGVATLMAIDALVRFYAGTFGNSGLPTPDLIWFGTPLALGMVATGLLWYSTAHMDYMWQRFVVVAAQILVGFILYMFAVFWYVIDTGIDAL